MSYQETLTAEINLVLDDLSEKGETWNAAWIAHAICNKHTDGLAENEHSYFWRHCGYQDCRDEVRRCINGRAGDRPTSDAQLRLPGYDHLQAYYIVKRDGDEIGVPVHDLTDDELEAKAALYRGMAAACYAHADEIDRFKRLRRNVA